MPATRPSSSSSTELATALPFGTQLDGFRIERLIPGGGQRAVYEATQVDLNRRVALEILGRDPEIGDRLRASRWPTHPNVVSLYAAGRSEYGYFLATALVDGTTLAELRRQRPVGPAEMLSLLTDVAGALDAAHHAGSVHGAVSADNVVVDRSGRALLTNFGLATEPGDRTTDLQAFATLVHACTDAAVPDPPPDSAIEIVPALPTAHVLPKRVVRTAGALVALALGAGAIVLLALSSRQSGRVPPLLRGATVLGSDLTAAGVKSVDCNGQSPSGASDACTVAQTRLGGRVVVPRQGGVIRRWTVRGARGLLALQVLRRRGASYFNVGQTQPVVIPDGGVHVFAADLPVRPGDLVGLQVAPGSAIGVRRGVRDAGTARWFGPLIITVRPPERGPGSGFDVELMLRVEYLHGQKWTPSGELTGRAAQTAGPGHVLAVHQLLQRGPRTLTLKLVRTAERIAVDLFAGRQRLARLPVTGADSTGRLLSFDNTTFRFGRDIVELQWRNPGGLLTHDYIADDYSLAPLS
jgi:Protein tyrosine and serine/threonine kinase